MRKKQYKFLLYIFLMNSICCLLCAGYLSCWQKTPSMIKIRSGIREKVDFSLPVSGELGEIGQEKTIPVSFLRPVTFYANKLDSYQLKAKLLGVVPLKSVRVEVVSDKKVIPAGIPIGIYVKTDGVLVLDTGAFTGADGNRYAPTQQVLRSGDYILKMNEKVVTGKKMFMDTLQEIGEEQLVLTIRRKEAEFEIRTKAIEDQSGIYKIGIWIRDNAQGVGTLTYIDDNGKFGALGHGINDCDTSVLMELQKGTLYDTDIVAVKKGVRGEPGELTGMIDYHENNVVGNIEKNIDQGIFGICKDKLEEKVIGESMKIGLKQDIKKGKAKILCSIEGNKASFYDVEIIDVFYESNAEHREIILKVTDQELLEKTGGIVQGMSGAPIIQDGKLIGAVTHVFVSDPTKGYGIFAETMLEQG